MLVDLTLAGDGFIRITVFLPGPRNVAEIALTGLEISQPGTASKCFDGHRVEALSLCPRSPAKLRVENGWDVSERVLHASTVGDACKQRKWSVHGVVT
jgi:hypothetical protein